MFQDYKVAYSEKGDVHIEEVKCTVTVGELLKAPFFLPSSDSSQFSAASHRTRTDISSLKGLVRLKK